MNDSDIPNLNINSNNDINNEANIIMVNNKSPNATHEKEISLSLFCGTADIGPGIGTLGNIWRPNYVNNFMISTNQPPSCGKAAFDSGKGAIGGGGGGQSLNTGCK